MWWNNSQHIRDVFYTCNIPFVWSRSLPWCYWDKRDLGRKVGTVVRTCPLCKFNAVTCDTMTQSVLETKVAVVALPCRSGHIFKLWLSGDERVGIGKSGTSVFLAPRKWFLQNGPSKSSRKICLISCTMLYISSCQAERCLSPSIWDSIRAGRPSKKNAFSLAGARAGMNIYAICICKCISAVPAGPWTNTSQLFFASWLWWRRLSVKGLVLWTSF